MSRALAKDQRIPLDAYYTPDAVALACVRTLGDLTGLRCWEPHAGGGAFVRALRSGGARVFATDINPKAPIIEEHFQDGMVANDWYDTNVCDFIGYPRFTGMIPTFDWIIGNPPFSEAEAHIRHALEDIKPRVGLAFLLRLAMLESSKRIDLWRDHPPACVYVLSERPSFTGGGTDSAAYGWFVWKAHKGETVLRWLSTREARA